MCVKEKETDTKKNLPVEGRRKKGCSVGEEGEAGKESEKEKHRDRESQREKERKFR